ncbi:phage head closure protein [Nocardiopsis lucentensis]|uniref:phage head closure protein n=1 Tax=Nocardiopsis lucentensis TaxID=53441 RepID=UPI0003467C95|nr:phage head closure protein [Nocardiopsis lucentensis]
MRRRAIGHLLNVEVTLWRRTTVPDGSGGQTTTWVEIGPVRCRISQPSVAERVAARQVGADHTQPIYLAPGTDVHRGDELRRAGQTWRVVAAVVPSEDVYLRADCELIQPEGA